MRGWVGALLAAGVLVLVPATPAVAAGDGLDIEHVEVAPDGQVDVLVSVTDPAGAGALRDVTVDLDQSAVPARTAAVEPGAVRRTAVLALDVSRSMRGAPIIAARRAALAFLDAAPADVGVGLVAFAGDVEVLEAPTLDRAALADQVRALRLAGGTHLYDAVGEALRVAGEDGARSVLLLTDGKDAGSSSTLAATAATLASGSTALHVVALEQGPRQRARLARLARAGGGDVVDAADPAALARAFAARAEALGQQVVVSFDRPPSVTGDTELEVRGTVRSRTLRDSALASLGSAAAERGAPAVVPAPAPLVGSSALWLGVAGLGAGLAALLGVLLAGRSRGLDARERLAVYLGESEATPRSAVSLAGVRHSALSVVATLFRGDREERLAVRLTGAGVAITTAEWILLDAAVAVAAGFVGLVLGGGGLLVVLLVLGAVAPWVWLRWRYGRRLRAFAAQLPETLTLVSGGLSAGLSFAQALDGVVREGQEPVASELQRALVEQRLGVGIEDALDAVAVRMGSADFAWVVMATRIQREVGGNLAELLTTVAETLREREYLRRQVHTLASEGRLSGWILGALPVVMFGYLVTTNRDFVAPLWTQPLGLLLSAGALALLALGAWSMSKLAKVEI